MVKSSYPALIEIAISNGYVSVVKSVSVAKAEPGGKSAREEVVHLTVKPSKIVNSLFLFGFLTARLNSYSLYAECGYFIVYLFGIKSITVELFHAKSHRGFLYVKRMTGLKLSYSL